jgi:hypothetical protein
MGRGMVRTLRWFILFQGSKVTKILRLLWVSFVWGFRYTRVTVTFGPLRWCLSKVAIACPNLEKGFTMAFGLWGLRWLGENTNGISRVWLWHLVRSGAVFYWSFWFLVLMPLTLPVGGCSCFWFLFCSNIFPSFVSNKKKNKFALDPNYQGRFISMSRFHQRCPIIAMSETHVTNSLFIFLLVQRR